MKTEPPLSFRDSESITADLDAFIAVGFGSAFVTRNGSQLWCEPNGYQSEDELWTFADAEAFAAADPDGDDSDWRVHLVGPLGDFHYQRQGAGRWVLYESGPGFA
jgi:hypothetical protein